MRKDTCAVVVTTGASSRLERTATAMTLGHERLRPVAALVRGPLLRPDPESRPIDRTEGCDRSSPGEAAVRHDAGMLLRRGGWKRRSSQRDAGARIDAHLERGPTEEPAGAGP